ncbi:hypothetical protein Tco_1388197 [Tanacetum coccineum]
MASEELDINYGLNQGDKPYLGRKALDDDDDVDVLDVLSLELRYNARKVVCGLVYRHGSSNDGNVILCV